MASSTMKWLKNLKNISKENKPGACPFCKSDNTDYCAVLVRSDSGYCIVWCNDCKHAYRVLIGGKIADDMHSEKEIPSDLNFFR